MNAECYYGGMFHSFMWYDRRSIRKKCKDEAREAGDDYIIIHFTDNTDEHYELHGSRWYSVPYFDPIDYMLARRVQNE